MESFHIGKYGAKVPILYKSYVMELLNIYLDGLDTLG